MVQTKTATVVEAVAVEEVMLAATVVRHPGVTREVRLVHLDQVIH
jgi:hypothetical protein